MRVLMLSLDKKILDPTSAAAQRMIEYGKNNELYIAIPHYEQTTLELSSTVHVVGSGGKSKLAQWWNLYGVGERLLKEKKFDQISVQDPFFIGLTGWWLKKQFGVPLEVQVHGDFFGGNYYRFKSGPINHLRWHIGKYVVRRANRVRVVGERVRQSVLALGVAPEKIYLRPVPVDSLAISNYQPKIDLHKLYPNFTKIFLVLGRLDPVKNIPWLIKMFKEIVSRNSNYGLLVVGDGSGAMRYTLRVTQLHLGNNVKFAPATNDPWSYLTTADCLLFPSLSEGYGLVAMEAHAAGTPVIMNDVGVANYELKPGPKVTILPIDDGPKWIEAILKI